MNGFLPTANSFSRQNQGAGVALADLNGNGHPELICFTVDNPVGVNRGIYQIGWDLDASGVVTGGWSPWLDVPGWDSWENQGADIVVTDLNGDGRPELIVFQIDHPQGGNRGLYRVGWNLDVSGNVTGGWTPWTAVPNWSSWENQCGGIAVADIDGNGRPELVVFQVDNPPGLNHGLYSIGWNLDATGNVTGGWSPWFPVDWFSWENQGAGISIADLDGNSRPEMIVFQVDNPPELNGAYYQVGWDLDTLGRVTGGWSPWVQLDWPSWENQGAGIRLWDVKAAGRPQLAVFMIDHPVVTPNQNEYRLYDLVLDIDTSSTAGTWRLLPSISPVLPVHAALLHTDRVLLFAGSSNDPQMEATRDFRSTVFDYSEGGLTTPATPIDFFCCGHSFLADGRLLVAGGTAQYDPFHGLTDVYIFDPATNQWVAVQNMAHGRWYPTLISLGDSRVLAISGYDENGNLNTTPEVFIPGTGWSSLVASGNWPLYGNWHLLADGTIFYSGIQYGDNKGTGPSRLNLSTNAVNPVQGLRSQPLRNQGTSVLLPPAHDQKVMAMGGGPFDAHSMADATGDVDIVDFTAANPTYQPGPSLRFPRMHLNAVVLPDYSVVVCGGSQIQEDRDVATLEAEVYTAASNAWTVVAKARVPRLYHSIALLLPDARVLTAGSNPERTQDELRLEIFCPPYLYKGARPVVDAVPAELQYDIAFQVQTAQAASIKWVSLIRPSATTHSCDTEQRLIAVSFLGQAGVLRCTAPSQRNLAPPGWYLLFVTDMSGVPSIGRWVHLT